MTNELDDWITNYELTQKQKHAQFLQNIKNEFSQRTRQRRRDRLNQINEGQIQGLQLKTSSRRGRTTASDTRKKT